jgi:hypothetical protein
MLNWLYWTFIKGRCFNKHDLVFLVEKSKTKDPNKEIKLKLKKKKLRIEELPNKLLVISI